MTAWNKLLPPALGRKRPEAPVSRAMLDIDAGALIADPTDYPYPPGLRPIRPFLATEVTNLGNRRSDVQLFPPHSLMGRTLAHLSWAGWARSVRSSAQDVSGERVPPRGYRVRPWLFGDSTGGGGVPRPPLPGTGHGGAPATGPCEDCD